MNAAETGGVTPGKSPAGAGANTAGPDGPWGPEPFAARLYFIPRLLRRPQAALNRRFHAYFARAPGWVLLTTRGRKTGLDREVLLPCERTPDSLIVISTYGRRSHWIRNLSKDARVRVTCGGWPVEAEAEIVEDPAARRALIAAHPFFVPAPFWPLNLLARTVLRPLVVWWLRRWVTVRPLVVIRPCAGPTPPAAPVR